MAELISHLVVFGISLVIFAALGGLVFLAHVGLTRLFADRPDRQHHRQALLIAVALFLFTLAFILMPVSDTTQGQLLAFFGIFLGAAIAFSAANPVANVLSGISLRASRELAIGDYIESADYRGRIVHMDLFGIVIDSDSDGAVSIPNLYLTANPFRILPSGEARLQLEVSIGYDVPRQMVEEILLTAARDSKVDDAVVEIGRLDERAASYRICGRVADAEQLTGQQLALRAAILDGLQDAGIVIGATVAGEAPQLSASSLQTRQAEFENSVAEKEQKAAALEALRKEYTEMSQRLIEVERELQEAGPGEERKPLSLEKKKLEAKLLRTEKEIARAEAVLEAA